MVIFRLEFYLLLLVSVPTFQYPISIYIIVIVSTPWSVSVWSHRQFWVTCSTIQDCQWSLPCSTIQFLLEGTVKVPEGVRFWHENVHFSVNHSSSCKKSYAVIGLEVFIHTKIVQVQVLWWQQSLFSFTSGQLFKTFLLFYCSGLGYMIGSQIAILADDWRWGELHVAHLNCISRRLNYGS